MTDDQIAALAAKLKSHFYHVLQGDVEPFIGRVADAIDLLNANRIPFQLVQTYHEVDGERIRFQCTQGGFVVDLTSDAELDFVSKGTHTRIEDSQQLVGMVSARLGLG